MHWIYIFIAAIFEVAWTYCLKFMNFSDFKSLKLVNIFTSNLALSIILPFLGYIFFGIGNIYFFSLALKKVPVSSAFAIWTVSTIILIKLSEIFIFNHKFSYPELLFILLITIGIIGLKVYSTN